MTLINNASKVVSVFGNPEEPGDSLAVRLVPELEKNFPDIDFQIVDPTENLVPPSDPWVIMDVGIGIDKVVVVDDINQLEYVGGQSVHDFDVYMELRLKEKLGKLPKIKIIIVPVELELNKAREDVVRVLSEIVL